MKTGNIFQDATVIQWQTDAAALEQIIERQGLDAFVSTLVFVLGERVAACDDNVAWARTKIFLNKIEKIGEVA